MKILKLLLLLFITFSFAACDTSLLNPDSYGKKWENTYLWFNPDDLETIYVSESGELNSAMDIKNKTDFEITWINNVEGYELTFTSFFDRIDFAWFEGYPVNSPSEEIPFIVKDNIYQISGNNLLPPENGLYRISLSKDLTK